MSREYYIYIDPDEPLIELQEFELTLETVCELLRADATEALELFNEYIGYIDGEGAWQGRQTEWLFDERSVYGPMVIVKGEKEEGKPGPCDEEDLEMIESLIKFLPTKVDQV